MPVSDPGWHKKDDTLGIESAKAWIESNPIPEKLAYWETEKIQLLALQMIENLKKVPLTASNIDKIKNHLVQISLESDRMRGFLIDNLTSSDTTKTSPLVRDLKKRLIFTYTSKV